MLAVTYFFDHIKNPSWLKHVTPKALVLVFAATLCTIPFWGKLYYDAQPRNFNEAVFLLTIRFQDFRYRLYSPILWFCLFVLSFHFLRKKFRTHHALWLSGLVFLSCQDVWELARDIQDTATVVAPTVTKYVFWMGPTFLVFGYAHKYVRKLTAPLCLAFFSSLLVTGLYMLRFPFMALGLPFTAAWPLRFVWVVAYVMLAYYMERFGNGES